MAFETIKNSSTKILHHDLFNLSVMMVKTDRRKSKAKYDFHKNHIFLPDIKGKEERMKEGRKKRGENDEKRKEKGQDRQEKYFPPHF